jgi:hypothetical protein
MEQEGRQLFLLLSGQPRDYAHQFSHAHFPKNATRKRLLQSLSLSPDQWLESSAARSASRLRRMACR